MAIADLSAQCLHPGGDLRFDNLGNSNHYDGVYMESAMADSKGYIWGCSPNAIYRYDGVKTTHFSTFEKGRHHLNNNYTAGLLEDEQGRLWLAGGGGLSYFDRIKDKFIYLDLDARRPITHAYAFCKRKNELWFSCNYGFCKVDLRTLKISTTALDKYVEARHSFIAGDSMIWISTNETFYFYNSRRNSYTTTTWKVNNRPLFITNIIKAGKGYYMGTATGLYSWKGTTERPVLINATKGMGVWDMQFHPSDKQQKYLWMATEKNGVVVLDTETGNIKYNYTHDDNNPYSIGSNEISSIRSGCNGAFIFATSAGVSIYDPLNQYMKERLINVAGAGRNDQVVSKIVRDRFDKRLVWMSMQESDIVCIDWDAKAVLQRYENVPTKGIIRDMAQIDAKRWLVLTKNELYVWSPAKGLLHTITKFPVCSRNRALLRLHHIIATGNGCYFITSNRGLFEYHLSGHTLKCVAEKKDDEINSCFYLLRGVYDNRGQLWIASAKGLFYYNIREHRYRNYLYKGNGDTLRANYCQDVDINEDGKLFLTSGAGLLVFDTASGASHLVKSFGDIDSVSCMYVLCDRNNVWINSDAGLLRYDPVKDSGRVVMNLDESAIVFMPATGFVGIDADIVTGLRNSFAYFNRNGFNNFKQPSAPHIESISINNAIIDSLLNPARSVRLPYQQNSIGFSFTAFEYNDPKHIMFRYKLQGVDVGWAYPEGRNANFLKLPPGKYVFLLQSGSKQNKWNEPAVSYHFEIEPPFWQTWWFMATLLLSIALLVFSFVYFKIKSIREKERQKTNIYREMSELELKALRSQMNPHFIFNSLNSIQKYILNNKQGDAVEYLAKFSRLIRLILSNSMHRQVTLEQELSALQLYIELEHRRCNDKFSYDIVVDKSVTPSQVLIQPMLLQPYVENAIWHGLMAKAGVGKLWIRLCRYGPSSITCIIEDNGIGRKKAEEIKNRKNEHGGLSYGMQLTGRRLLMADRNHPAGKVTVEDLYDNAGIAAGTKIILQIPVETFQKIG